MAKYYPQRNQPGTAISNGQTHQDGAWKPFPCPLSPFSFPLSLFSCPLSPVPLSPSPFAELQEVCRGFVLLLIHVMDVVLQQKRETGMALLGTEPGDQGMLGTAMTRGTGGSRSTPVGCKRFPKLMPDASTPRPQAASSSSPVDHSAEPLSQGTGCPCLPQALAVRRLAESKC